MATSTNTATATSTSTPVPSGETTLTEPADAGDTEIFVASTEGFEIGDTIRINPGGENEEDNVIAGFASIVLEEPLLNDHDEGEAVVKIEEEPVPSQTAQVTKTAQVTRTVQATKTVEVTETPETPEATDTPERENKTHTPTASATSKPKTPQPSTTAAQTPSPVSTVLGTTQGPRGGAGGTISLPNAGQGTGNSALSYLLAVVVLAVTGAGMVGAVAWRQRRR